MTILRPLVNVRSALVAALLLTALSSCTSTPAPPSPSSAPITSTAPTVDASAVLETGEAEGDAPEPTWDDAARASAVQLAERAVAAWLNTGRGEQAWRDGLASWLSPDAVDFYAAVDPRNIAPGAVDGASRVVDESSVYLAVVEVPTTAGSYTVTLNRVTATDPWHAQRVKANS